MKIFIADCGWQGCVMTIAKDLESAKKQIEDSGNDNYEDGDEITEHDIVEGFVFANYGDM